MGVKVAASLSHQKRGELVYNVEQIKFVQKLLNAARGRRRKRESKRDA